jgi:hypothetical protein
MSDGRGSAAANAALGLIGRFGIHKAAPAFTAETAGPVQYCGVCGQHIKSVPGGMGPVWVHSDSGAVAAPNPPCYQGGWKLMHDNHALVTGTEQEVKAAAQEQVADAHQRYHHDQEGLLRAELYLERPDGTHLGQKYDEAGFVPGESIQWIDVDW